MQPASKRSRSTQVSDEFVRRQQAADPPPVAPPDDLCRDQMARLDKVVELLEQLADYSSRGVPLKAGLEIDNDLFPI